MKQNGANVFVDDDIHSPNRRVYLYSKKYSIHSFIKFKKNIFSKT